MSASEPTVAGPLRASLEDALRRECEAHRRLLHVAAGLEAAGHAELGALSRETALAQAAHAVELLDLLRTTAGAGSPVDELRQALAVQREEADRLYPDLARAARDAGDAPAAALFERLARAETALCARLERALADGGPDRA
ncbi:MAG: hypothetical protein NDJ94_09140 [Vicinamibacteria bacterium]|nr:hypothetical protein [Vicinamibacteria bacterium]